MHTIAVIAPNADVFRTWAEETFADKIIRGNRKRVETSTVVALFINSVLDVRGYSFDIIILLPRYKDHDDAAEILATASNHLRR